MKTRINVWKVSLSNSCRSGWYPLEPGTSSFMAAKRVAPNQFPVNEISQSQAHKFCNRPVFLNLEFKAAKPTVANCPQLRDMSVTRSSVIFPLELYLFLEYVTVFLELLPSLSEMRPHLRTDYISRISVYNLTSNKVSLYGSLPPPPTPVQTDKYNFVIMKL